MHKKEINKVLREYWSIVYRGKDIDEIFIKAEKATTGAKSYDYRVVMKQGDTGVKMKRSRVDLHFDCEGLTYILLSHLELDMRGRCSRGQKVRRSFFFTIL